MTNCNEQRLPLKKRHYHLVSNNVDGHKAEADKTDEVDDEEKSKHEKKDKIVEKENKVQAKCHTPAPKNQLNNNDYEVKVSVSF